MLIAGLCAGSSSVFTRAGAGYYNCSEDDAFASDREIECGTTDPTGDPVCRPIIAALCTGADAFKPAVGGGGYPCSTDSAFEGARDSYCGTASVGDPLCDSSRITRICLAGNIPFSPRCGAIDGMAHAVERGKACAAGATDSSCGSEDSVGVSYLKTYCATTAGDTNAAYCPVKYAGAVVDSDSNLVNVSDLTGKALNATGTALLTGADGTVNTAIISSGGASDADADANFIAGDTAALNLGGSVTTTNEATLTITGDATSGFALATGEFANGNNRYVGLLAGTNLGAPLTDSSADGAWTATVRVIEGDTLQDETEELTTVQVLRHDTTFPGGRSIQQGRFVDKRVQFTLSVNFANKTIETNTSAPVIGTLGTIGINGKFTVNGLIYGSVDFGGPTNTATLTGLIGTTGAVGIFASNDDASTAYVGGFVASKSSLDCSATGDPFNSLCTDNNAAQAVACKTQTTYNKTQFRDRCKNNARVTNLVCKLNGPHADLFNLSICEHTDVKRVELCSGRNSGLYQVPAGFEGKCATDPGVKLAICATSGQYANPFDTAICTGDQTGTQRTFLTNCQQSVGVLPRASASKGANCFEYAKCVSNPFDTTVCPDAGDTVRAQACIARNLARGVTLAANCAGDNNITALICATSGELANPFDTGICTGDQTANQSAFVNNCRADNAENSVTNNANGANCARYTACRANPFRGACDEAYYEPERHDYTVSVLAHCSNSDRASATAPVGFTNVATDCVTQQVRTAVCASSGEYANPLDAEVCPAEDCIKDNDGSVVSAVAGVCPARHSAIATIQSEFASACYDARNAVSLPTECTNIKTCFDGDNLTVGSVMAGGINCATNVALTYVRALDLCQGQTSGGDLSGTSCVQATLTTACTANPFSEVVNGKGVNCLSDKTTVVRTADGIDGVITTLDDLREQLCINDSTKYSCSATTTRVCGVPAIKSGEVVTTPAVAGSNSFSDLCYGNDGFADIRHDACNAISDQITYNTARTNSDPLLQNCLDTIDYECQYSEEEQFVNRFCQIGTLYDKARGEACIAGTAPSDAICGNQDSGVIKAYCATDAALTDLVNCPTRFATLNGDASAVTVPVYWNGSKPVAQFRWFGRADGYRGERGE